jgi:hypothetical protein
MAPRHLTMRIMFTLGYKIRWRLISSYRTRSFVLLRRTSEDRIRLSVCRSRVRYAVTGSTFLRTLPLNICRPHLAYANKVVRTPVFRILGVSHDVQKLDQLNCAKRKLSLPTECRGLNVASLELDDEPTHYASMLHSL